MKKCIKPEEIISFIEKIDTNDELQEQLISSCDFNIGYFELEEIKKAILSAIMENLSKGVVDPETFMKMFAIVSYTLGLSTEEDYKSFYDAHYKK